MAVGVPGVGDRAAVVAVAVPAVDLDLGWADTERCEQSGEVLRRPADVALVECGQPVQHVLGPQPVQVVERGQHIGHGRAIQLLSMSGTWHLVCLAAGTRSGPRVTVDPWQALCGTVCTLL